MSEVTYTLLTDGSSDACLMPILDWLLKSNEVRCAIQREWANLSLLRRKPVGLAERVERSLELYPCDLRSFTATRKGNHLLSAETRYKKRWSPSNPNASLPGWL